MDNGAIKFLAGAAVGALLTKAAIKYSETEEGKMKKEKMQKMIKDFSNFVVPRVKNMADISRMRYKKIVSMAASDFGKIKNLSEQEIEDLEGQTLELWEKFIKNPA
jgi:hypothetical protein